MNETDASFRRLRQYIVRKTIEVISDRIHRIDHDSLGCAGMRALALECNCRGACAPRLIADLSELFTVNSVSHLRTERFYVKLLDTTADFLVRNESDRERSVF